MVEYQRIENCAEREVQKATLRHPWVYSWILLKTFTWENHQSLGKESCKRIKEKSDQISHSTETVSILKSKMKNTEPYGALIIILQYLAQKWGKVNSRVNQGMIPPNNIKSKTKRNKLFPSNNLLQNKGQKINKIANTTRKTSKRLESNKK